MNHLRLRLAAPVLASLIALSAFFVPSAAFAMACDTPNLYQQIDTGTSTTFATIHFASIPTLGPSSCTYSNIRVTGVVRTTGTACDSYVDVRFGTGGTVDSLAHYNYMHANFTGSAGTTSQGGTAATDHMSVSTVPCSTDTATNSGTFEFIVPNAFGTTYDKDLISVGTDGSSTLPGDHVEQVDAAGAWVASGAISDVVLYPNDGSNWAAHTVINLYEE